jgi:hypothetical protein
VLVRLASSPGRHKCHFLQVASRGATELYADMSRVAQRSDGRLKLLIAF